MKSAIKVLKEQIDYFHLIRRLSLFELKNANQNNYLGIVWEVITPSIQIAIYWFVFGTLRDRDPVVVDGVDIPFFLWLMVGFILWIFFQKSTTEASRSIFSRLKMLSKMNFPMSVIPSFVIFSKFYVHMAMLGLTIIILQITGFFINIYYLQLIYYVIATMCLLFAIALIMSTLSTIIRDIHMFLTSTIRMLLYLSGVLWPITILSDWPIIMNIMKLNPLYYLIEGYRHALLGSSWYFIDHWQYTLYFWGLVIVLLLIGSALHMKFRRHFIDYL